MPPKAERHDGPPPTATYSIGYTHADGSMEFVEFDAADREIHRTYSECPETSWTWTLARSSMREFTDGHRHRRYGLGEGSQPSELFG